MARKDKFRVALGVVNCQMDLWNNIYGVDNLRSLTGQYFQRSKRLHTPERVKTCLDTEGEPYKATGVIPQFGLMTGLYR